MHKRVVILFAAFFAVLVFLAGCGQKNDRQNAAAPGKTKITDLAGREVYDYRHLPGSSMNWYNTRETQL